MAAKKTRTRRSSIAGIEFNPIKISFQDKTKNDKEFLISMIDDPVMTFRKYGYNGDDLMMATLQGMSEDIRQRAILVFGEILKYETARNGCNACNACRACKACTSIMGGGIY